MKIVIVGGTGTFGKFWKDYFTKKGFEVIISSRNSEIKPKDAILLGDVIIFSISIRNSLSVMQELIPLISENKLVMDFTGIKSKTTLELSKYTLGEVVATHPMFGPWIKSLENQNIAFDPINPGEKWKIISDIWKKDKANLIEMTSLKHDKIVSVVQSSVHFANLLLGHILKKENLSINEILAIGTPNSRMQMLILSRFLNQESSLYTDMQFFNEYYKNNILPDIQDYISLLEGIINSGNTQKFENEFNNLKNYIGQDFLNKALETTNIIDKEIKKIV
ncbi:MAG: prephenate dehydrogenase/arogenate dehydrogenase family protein [Candidatus Gracilibacteria bacterium]|nr:prephenate dehydrogenase/arogenate dehydrogenase family protein [Candidatus Gracilibacteria bacterium]